MSLISRPEKLVFKKRQSSKKNQLSQNKELFMEDEYDLKLNKFKSGFSEPKLRKLSTLNLASNINLIYMTLIALTKLFKE